MPQIRIIGEEAVTINFQRKPEIGQKLIKSLEELWPKTEEDVTCTVMKAERTFKEQGIQVELYCASEYLCQNGERFSPNEEDLQAAFCAIAKVLQEAFLDKGIQTSVVSRGKTMVFSPPKT